MRTIRLVQWLSWVFATQARERKEKKNSTIKPTILFQWARANWRGFSPVAAARHRGWTAGHTDCLSEVSKFWFFFVRSYSRVPAHRNHGFDPVSVFLSTHWWSQQPACQRFFYKTLRNCHPSQRVSTPPRNSNFGARGKRRGFSPGAAARHSQSARAHMDSYPKTTFFHIFLSWSWTGPLFRV